MSDMGAPSADDYTAAMTRLSQLRERRAGLAALEEQKRTRAEELRGKLREAGVNVDDLPGEYRRLCDEMSAAHQEIAMKLDGFEAGLAQAEAGETAVEVSPGGSGETEIDIG